jgi:hypothetical protein
MKASWWSVAAKIGENIEKMGEVGQFESPSPRNEIR